MECTRHQSVKIFILLALGASFCLPGRAQTAAPEPSVAIVYDGAAGPKEYQSKGYIHALFVENLLGHFGLKGDIIALKDYDPGQLAGHRAAFFVGVTTSAELPPAFLADVKAFGEPFCWLGQHIEQLVNTPEGPRRYGFTFQQYGKNMGVNRVVYKGAELPKVDPELVVVEVTDKRAVEVVATALTKDQTSYPYALHRKRFWYFADSPFAYPDEGGYYLAFCDLLHDILEIQHEPSQRALVRIEDVSIDDDPVDLRRVADLLNERHIPFQIALIPVFRNPSKELDVRLSERRSFADSVRYMIARGGTPILHGVTHQYRGQSGDDYEFWDDTGDRAVAGDSTEFVMKRLQLGLSECFKTGIYPVAFETPHYAASRTDYLAMMRVFTLFYDRTISTPSLNSQQYFPYPVVDHWGRQVVPEDLGYLPEEKPDPKVLLERTRNLRVVRDGVASFYFHPFLNANLLDQVVRGISALGYQFVSIREFAGQVNYQGRYAVRTAAGKANLTPQNEYWRVRQFDSSGREVKTELSAQRLTGPVEVAVNVPQGGFAAADCVRERPTELHEPTWGERARQWWSQLWASERTPEAHEFVSGRKAWVLAIDKPTLAVARNQQSYRTVLETFGYQAKLVKAAEFTRAPAESDTILIVPQAAGARLTEQQQSEVLRYLGTGGPVVFDGRQDWLTKLGFTWSDRQLTVSNVSDELYPEMYLIWHPEERVELFTPPETIRELMLDTESNQVLAFSDDYRAGRYLYLAAPLDAHTNEGTSHYPYFPKYLSETFGISTSLRSPRLEAYFDPGDRPGADLNRLAAQWRQSGIRTVYAAAWTFFPQYSFNYGEFVRACHRNGVSVYAWFILPATTPKMWDQHPEWREKTASGADGRVGWRYTMNLQNPACYGAAMDWMKKVLSDYAWDGVNLTELNFDADFKDWLRPDRFIPMSNEVRADFRKKSGFDPIQLFAADSPYYLKTNPGALQRFLKYRENLVTEWHRKVLGELEPMRRQRSWEVIVTMMDSLHSKYVQPALGVDSKRIVALMKDFNFTLQVEDPAEFWMKSPDRYLSFAQTYRKLVKDPRRLMFDINVMPRDTKKTTLPSATATGTELARTVVSAASASGAGRVAIYSENTVPAQDWQFLRVVLTRAALVDAGKRSWRIDSPVPVMLTPSEDRDYYLDGKLWPAVSSDGVLVPTGRHGLSIDRPWHHFLDPGTMPTRLLSISGDLLDARVMPTGLVFWYSSPGRAVVVLNQWPREIQVDGRRSDGPVESSGASWALILPGGEHRVAVVTNTTAGVAVNLWGWASASAITAFGGIATVLMALIYFEVRLRRLVKQLAARSS